MRRIFLRECSPKIRRIAGYVTDFWAALSEKKTSNISSYLFTVPNRSMSYLNCYKKLELCTSCFVLFTACGSRRQNLLCIGTNQVVQNSKSFLFSILLFLTRPYPVYPQAEASHFLPLQTYSSAPQPLRAATLEGNGGYTGSLLDKCSGTAPGNIP